MTSHAPPAPLPSARCPIEDPLLPRPAWAGIGAGIQALVVEDDARVGRLITTILSKAGFRVRCTPSGEEALRMLEADPATLVLLDLGLPDRDGFTVCRDMRERCPGMGILILTGRTDSSDRVKALNLGADGYLVKPFDPDVLLAHIQAVLRRCQPVFHAAHELSQGDVRLDYYGMKVFKSTREVELTPREFALLAAFLRNPGRVMTRDQLHEAVWGENHHGSSKSLDVLVCRLREKLEDDASRPRFIRTEWGVGFICS